MGYELKPWGVPLSSEPIAHSLLRRIRLPARVRLRESVELHALVEDPHDRSVWLDVAIRVLRTYDLAGKADVGHRDRIAVTEFPCARVAVQERLDCREAQPNPVSYPLNAHRLAQLQVLLHVVPDARHHQRMDLGDR